MHSKKASRVLMFLLVASLSAFVQTEGRAEAAECDERWKPVVVGLYYPCGLPLHEKNDVVRLAGLYPSRSLVPQGQTAADACVVVRRGTLRVKLSEPVPILKRPDGESFNIGMPPALCVHDQTTMSPDVRRAIGLAQPRDLQRKAYDLNPNDLTYRIQVEKRYGDRP